jgi:hypothetical protein
MRDTHDLGGYRGMVAAPTASPDLNELRGFCVAADLGSLGRAAVRLRVSQPSLSKRWPRWRPRWARDCSSAPRAASP